jgi:hypothetical protein
MSTPAKRVARRGSRSVPTLLIEGFKSFRQLTQIDLRPLTIFSGANSSGKSSTMQPLLLLKQTLEAPFDPGPVRLDGPIVKFTDSRQLIWRLGAGKSTQHFTIGIRTEARGVTSTFRVGHTGGIQLDRTGFEWPGGQIEISHATSSDTIRGFLEEFRDETSSAFWMFDALKRAGQELIYKPVENRFSMNVGAIFRGESESFLSVFDPWEDFNSLILGLIHVEGLRGNPERAYPFVPSPSKYEGSFRREYVAGLLWTWQESRDIRLETLSGYLRDLGLTWKVQLRKLSEVAVELRVGRSPLPRRGGAQDLVNIADVGFGVSQVLPVLVALLAATPGQLVYVEQPELHLHPRAQVALGHILADAANRGVRVVIETHSQLLIRSIQALVAEQVLTPQSVGLHWFERDEDGQTIIRVGEVDRFGTYGDWPEDFADVQLDVEGRFLDAPLRAIG